MNLHNLIPGLLEHCLCAPDLQFDEKRTRIFEDIYETACRGEDTVTIEYNCEYPKHEFLSYLVEHKNVLLHGSNEKKIRYLMPMRRTTDLRQVGNLDAIYACSDGIWPIFFAIWQRGSYPGTSNFCFQAKDAEGKLRKYYSFYIAVETSQREAIEAGDQLCWTDGMVYILSRDSFTRLIDDAGNPLEEWASTKPVRALARLPVSPQDFVFLDEVSISEKEFASFTRPPLKVDINIYDGYIGAYEVSPDLVINLERRKDSLFAQVAGFPTVEMHPESETDFLLADVNGKITFVRNDQGEATNLIVVINGMELNARKI